MPREWYGYDPNLEYWYTPPYFDPAGGATVAKDMHINSYEFGTIVIDGRIYRPTS